MSKSKQFMGIDISKKIFDVTIIKNDSVLLLEKFSNTIKGINQYLKWLDKNEIYSDKFLITIDKYGIYIVADKKTTIEIIVPVLIHLT